MKSNVFEFAVYQKQKRNEHWQTDLIHFMDGQSHPCLTASMRGVTQSFIEYLAEQNLGSRGALILGLGARDQEDGSFTLEYIDNLCGGLIDRPEGELPPTYATLHCREAAPDEQNKKFSSVLTGKDLDDKVFEYMAQWDNKTDLGPLGTYSILSGLALWVVHNYGTNLLWKTVSVTIGQLGTANERFEYVATNGRKTITLSYNHTVVDGEFKKLRNLLHSHAMTSYTEMRRKGVVDNTPATGDRRKPKVNNETP